MRRYTDCEKSISEASTLAVFLLIILCSIHLAAFTCFAEAGEFAAGEPYTDEHGVTYTWETDGQTVRITGADCDAERYEMIIPEEIDGKPVTELFSDDRVFTVNDSVTAFGIPDTITSFTMTDAFGSSYDLFGWAENLQEIRVSDSHPALAAEDGVLYNKEMTRLIKYPGGKADTKYVMPGSVTEVRSSSLKNVKALEELVISNNVTYLQYAVYSCPALRRVYLGKLDSYNSKTLIDCTELESLTVSEDNTALAAVDGDLYTKDMKTLVCHPPKGSDDEIYKVRDGVECISDYALSYADYKEVELPDTLISVDECAFEGCPDLELLVFPENVRYIGGYQFWGCESLKYVYIPASAEDITDFTEWCDHTITIYGKPGSKGEEYALQHADTTKFVNITEEKIPQDITCSYEDVSDDNASIEIELSEGTLDLGCRARRGVTYSSDDPDVAGIDENGIVTLKSGGTTVIHIRANVAAGEEQYFMQTERVIGLKVTAQEKKTQNIKGKTSFSKTYGSSSFSLGQSALTRLRYKSSNTKIAKVSSSGKVTILRPGKVRITVSAPESNEYKAAVKTVTLNIKVKRPVLSCKAGKGKTRVSWSKVPKASGYALYIKYPGSKKYERALTTKSNVKGFMHGALRSGKTYRYKLRAFVKIGGKKYYSDYSKVKKVRIK